jgi:hypothetical protein
MIRSDSERPPGGPVGPRLSGDSPAPAVATPLGQRLSLARTRTHWQQAARSGPPGTAGCRQKSLFSLTPAGRPDSEPSAGHHRRSPASPRDSELTRRAARPGA